jgi:hypothetical protein
MQWHFINSTIVELKLITTNATGHCSPALSSVILHKDKAGKTFNNSFHFCGEIKLSESQSIYKPRL